jgi:CheY-like chemotaxis protein
MNFHKIMTPPSSKTTRSAKGNRSIEPLTEDAHQSGFGGRPAEGSRELDQFINSFSDFTCICACATGEEALRVIPPEQPDVVLMDLFLPRMSGIECTVRLKALLPQTQIIILTAMDDEELVFLALEAGADGYLLKRTSRRIYEPPCWTCWAAERP